ncbi:hypothetical protein [Edaphocola flava]|uniref:hypothetical protein n=1 Tax=Edaphocola flava TaxID=2499629 RepID=UPI00100ADCF0|nr:hypothetical protein [Edaphocola flava]
MEFDFYKKYQTLSDAELMHICHNPTKYQPRAVEDARRVLEERNVDIAGYVAEEIPNAAAPKKPSAIVEKIGRIFEETAVPKDTWDFDKEGSLQEHPKAPVMVTRWHWAIFAIMILSAIRNTYFTLRLLVSYIMYPDSVYNNYTVLFFWVLLSALEIAIVCGLYKRTGWSWSLLVGYLVVNLGVRLIGLYDIFMDPYTNGIADYWQGANTIYLLLTIALLLLFFKPFMQVLTERGVTIPETVPEAKLSGKDNDLIGNPYNKLSWDFDAEEGVLTAGPEIDHKALQWHQYLCVSLIVLTAILVILKQAPGLIMYGLCIYALYKFKSWGWYLLQYFAISNIVAVIIEVYSIISIGALDYFADLMTLFRIGTAIYFGCVLVVIHKDRILNLFNISHRNRRNAVISVFAIIAVIRVLFYLRYN